MATLSLRIHIVKSSNVKMMQVSMVIACEGVDFVCKLLGIRGKLKPDMFEEGMIVYDACRMIRERIPDAAEGQANEFGLFKADDDPIMGRWLEMGRTLEYYHLKDGDVLDYRIKQRPLRVKTLDGSIKTVLVDDSQNVSELIKAVCAKIGLSNPEEFSFITEEELNRPSRKPGVNQKKMDAMKKQLHTDDTFNWLNPEKSLREQGVDETQVLVLRKKFFFSDQNVDRNDPVQLHLLYIQSHDAIADGTHPVTKDEAIQFAALQCQIQFQNYNEAKHKPGFLELVEFLPKEYVKIKGIERVIFVEYKKLHSLNELNAKFRYIQLCRSLKTYGVTFFLVKEKMKGRNKLVPRLLGITRESVMRVDESTKEMLKTWPLTTVRRWAASPNSFTLDFGDYSESYYSVQTSEGETISQLIAGYIDIIIKKKKARQFDADGDDEDENAITEFEVGSKRANMTSIQGGGMNSGVEGSVANRGNLQQAHQAGGAQLHEGILPQQGQSTSSGTKHSPLGGAMSAQVLQAQQMLKGTINDSIGSVTVASSDLTSMATLPALGSDSASRHWRQATLDVSKQNVSSALAAMLASTASIITQTGMETSDVNYTAVGSAVTTISTNLTELVRAIRLLAALSATPGEGQRLLDAARKLAAATAGLLNTAQPENVDNRQDLLVSAGEMGSSGGQLLQLCGEATVDKKTQETLIAMAKAVASSTATLVSNARNVAAKCQDQALQNQVITGAKATALATQALIACTKVLSPTIDNPLCQEQLIEACKLVAGAVERIVIAAQAACDDDDALRDLGAAATAVTQALHSLIQQIREGMQAADDPSYDEACEVIIAASESLVNALGNAQEMVAQAKRLAEATQSLINSLRVEADGENDADARKKLHDAARALADATSKMVESAKAAAKNAGDPLAQHNLQSTAASLRNITNSTATEVLKKRAVKKLEVACRHTCAISMQLIAAAQGAGSSNTNESSQQQLMLQCKAVSEQVSHLVQSVRASMHQPDTAKNQLDLINSSQAMLAPAGRLVAASKAAVPMVSDPATALQLGNFAKGTAMALSELRSASAKASEVCGSLEIDSALDVVSELEKDLAMYKREAAGGKLLLLPGETVMTCALKLGAVSKAVGSSMAQLLTAANQGNESYTGVAARETANSLKELCGSVRGVAAGTTDKRTQEYTLQCAQHVMEQSKSLISEAKEAVQTPDKANKQMRLAQAAKAVSQALNTVVNCLPGQRDVDNAIKDIARSSQVLLKNEFPRSGEAYHVLQSKLRVVVGSLNESAASLFTAARGSPAELATAAKTVSEKFQEVLAIGMLLAGSSQDKQTQDFIVGFLRTISVSSSKLLLAAKSLSADPNAPNVMNQLTAAARAVTDSINELLNVCSSSGPGQRECDNALRKIEAAASLLESLTESVSDVIYYDCVEVVNEKSQVLAQSAARIPMHAKNNSMDELGTEVTELANAVCLITEATAQSAYLIGIGDSTSVAAQQGLVDQASFARAGQAISIACQSLLSSSSSQQQVLAAATVIAKHTSVLCTACKTASSRTNNPVAKRHFVIAAKEVANNTANLVKNIKALASAPTAQHREACAGTTKPLIESVDALTTFASSPQYGSTQAVIGVKGHREMQPILSGGKAVISSSCSLLAAAKGLSINPNDAATWQLIAAHAKALGDAVRTLMSALKDKAPGQDECEKAVAVLNASLNQMDKAGMAVLSQTLPPMASSSLEGFQDRLLQTCADIGEVVDPLTVAALGEAQNLGHRVTTLANQFPQLVATAIGAASRTASSQLQMSLVQETKTVVESALQLVYASKDAGGNPKSTTQVEVNEAGELVKEAVKDLSDTIQNAGSDLALINSLIDEVNKATAKVDELSVESSKNFTDYQEVMFDLCKAVAKKSQDIAIHTGQDPSCLTDDARELTESFCELIHETRGAIGATETDEVALWMKKSVCSLGNTTAELLGRLTAVVANPDDSAPKRELLITSKAELEKVSNMVAALKSGSKGTQACNEAVSTISGLVGDLETTAMFAAAGALQSEGSTLSFTENRENILFNAKTLVTDTKNLVGAAGLTQERLADAANKAVVTITKETEHIKLGAGSLGSDDIEAQVDSGTFSPCERGEVFVLDDGGEVMLRNRNGTVLLLNAAKDVAASLKDLIVATKSAAGKPSNDPTMETLKTSAKKMVTSVSNLLKTVKNVEDESGKGVKSLENAIERISSELEDYKSPEVPRTNATPEQLIRSTNAVTMATAKAVSAGNSTRQEDITATANMSRNAIANMLKFCKASAYKAETREQKEGVLVCGRECAEQYQALLRHVHSIVTKPSYEKKQKLLTMSRDVALSVTALVHAGEALKGPDWINPEDPTVMAESELLKAAAQIEAAARKLDELQPRRVVVEEESVSLDDQIVEAAMRIARATGQLLKAATDSQRELVAQGRVKVFDASTEDYQWSEGLVSAGKLVATATSNLCEVSNLAVQGQASEEKLVAAAKSVASSTAQLLIACQVKSDIRSDNNKRLQMAGGAVKKATETLVKAANAAKQSHEDISDYNPADVNLSLAKRMAAELDAVESITAKERELGRARNQLKNIRLQTTRKW